MSPSAHPLMFDADDPVLARVREIALGLPGAAEKVSHGRVVFFTKKLFAWYGGSVKVDGAYVQHERSVCIKPDTDERQALLEEPGCYSPAYLAPSGWVGVDLVEPVDWERVAELVEMSFRETAGTRLVAELDSRRG